MNHRTLLRSLFICCCCFLCFILGAASMYFSETASGLIRYTFDGIDAFQKRMLSANIATLEEYTPTPHITNNGAAEAYTLYNLRYQNHAQLVDNQGKILHTWRGTFSEVFANPIHVNNRMPDSMISWDKTQLLPNGDLLVSFFAINDTPYGYGLAKLDKNSKVIWTYNASVHHEFYVSPSNGHIFLLTQEFLYKPIKGLESLPYVTFNDYVVELTKDGHEIRKISLLEALGRSPYNELANKKQPYGTPWDHTHSNSVMKLEPDIAAAFPMFKPGQVLISIRNLDALAVLDMESEDIVWAANGPWRSQHSASFLANGNILLFDNRGMNLTYSRALEFDPKSLAMAWSYGGTDETKFYSDSLGQTQRIANGNNFINAALDHKMFEVNADGKKIWEMTLPEDYLPFNPSLPPFGAGDLYLDDEEALANFNLASVIISARRYTPEQLPFLQEKNTNP